MESDRFYHIYNRTNGNELLFKQSGDYDYFLRQIGKYINPIAEVYAYCLIPNHFHLIIRIKDSEVLVEFFKNKLKGPSIADKKPDLNLIEQEEIIQQLISKQFSHLFNSYVQAFNKRNGRRGSLFTPSFKRKEITTELYLKQVIVYVHLNPEHHSMGVDFKLYHYSSYQSILSNKPSSIMRRAVLELFEDKLNFIRQHINKSFLIESKELEG